MSTPTGRPHAAPPGPVRVCFIIDLLGAAGTESQLLALIRNLDRSRVVPHLVLLRGEDEASRRLEPDDCEVLRLNVSSLHRPSTFAAALRLVRFLRERRVEVVQAYFPDSSYFGLPAAWAAGVPHRVRTRNNINHWMTPFHRFLGRLLNPLVRATVANSEAARRAVLADEKPEPDSVVVLENGVDLERFAAVPPLAPRPAAAPHVVGVVANLRPVKGLDVFLRAAALVRAEFPGTTFRIAGEGPSRVELRGLVSEFGLAECVEMPGLVADIPGFLAGLDVAVLSSHAEGMPNAVLEYMAAGRPVVATAVGGTAGLLEDGAHGLLVPPGDPRRLGDAILELLRDPARAAALGAAARHRAAERYSRAAMVRRFEGFYERLRADSRPTDVC